MNEQQAINGKILQSLDDIQAQNGEIVAKIDHLQNTVTKKATVAGATAGAVAGGLTGGIISLSIEFLRVKFGG